MLDRMGRPQGSDQASPPAFDEDDAFICAAKGEPYTLPEWDAEVDRLMQALGDARRRRDRAAREGGVCLPARFGHA